MRLIAAHQFNNVFRLAVRDYQHEWRMSGCFILALAAVLAPMLVLFGLKFGVVSSMVEALVEDPRNREIRPVGSGHYKPEWFESLRSRPDVAFIIPRTRTISATMQLYSSAAGRIVSVELIPSSFGDPLLAGEAPIALRLDQIVISASAAQKLGVAAGDQVLGSFSRKFHGKRERVSVELTVARIAEAAAFTRDGAFVSLELAAAAEDFRDGRAVPALGWTGNMPNSGSRAYPGYRLYAHSIYDVARLRDDLMAEGLEVRTNAADIQIVQSVDRNLGIVFWIIALVALVGFSLSLGASLWANVDRKRRELSVLRLVGFNTGSIVWFPVLQALLTALLGWLLAAVIYLGVEQAINQLFELQIEAGRSICRLLPVHFLVAMILTTSSAVLAAALAGYRAARIEPSEGLREI